MTRKFQFLKVHEEDRIGTLTLNRPDSLNALSVELLQEIIDASVWFNSITDLRVVIIKGEGRAFSSGADLKSAMINLSQDDSWIDKRERAQVGFKMTQAVTNIKAVTIAQVHGFAIGGGFLLMLTCDFRIVTDTCFFSIPELDLGIPLTWGGIPKLVAEIGPLRTKELVMTCRRFYPEEAKSWGLINQIVNQEELESTCLKLANDLKNKPSLPLRITKEQINAVAHNIGSAYLGTAEGDILRSVLSDPESLQAARDYAAKKFKK